MSIPALAPAELDCLGALAAGTCDRPDLCPPRVLRRLLEHRLIEPVPVTWLPVPVIRPGYRLTARGQLACDEYFSKY